MALSNEDRNANQIFTKQLIVAATASQDSYQVSHCKAARDAQLKKLLIKDRALRDSITADYDARVAEHKAQLTACKLAILYGIGPFRWLNGASSVTPTECEGCYENLVEQETSFYELGLKEADEQYKKERSNIEFLYRRCMREAQSPNGFEPNVDTGNPRLYD